MHSCFPNDRRRRSAFALPAALLLAGLLLPSAGFAQEQADTRRLLDQRIDQQAQARERELLKDELDAERPTLTIDGERHVIGHNVDDVGRALYLALQQRQWSLAAHFLHEYLTLPGHDELLVHYAQGGLLRIQGKHAQAAAEYRALLALQPDFMPAQLELARTLFEDQQDREADALFADVGTSIDANDPKTEGVRTTIASFRQALAQRERWSGSYAAGPSWTDNANRTSASRTCLLLLITGDCLIERKLPEAITATGIDYDATLNKRHALRGHHGVYLRAIAFGQNYRDNSAYNELNAALQAGYSFRSARHNLALAPSFDHYALGNSALFGAPGVHAEWSWTPGQRSMLKLEADWKDLRYRQRDYALNLDGVQRTASATYFRSLGSHWMAFGGIDALDSDSRDRSNGYRSLGARIGASLQWPEGFSHTLFASYRRRSYDLYSPMLGVRRDDDERNYTLIIKARRLAFAGFTPLLSLRYNVVSSNVDWLYSYDRSTASLKLERSF